MNIKNYWVINKYENTYRIVTAVSHKEAAEKACRLHDDGEFLVGAGEQYLIVLEIKGDEPQFTVCPTTSWTVK
jgi:hypothetical protein